MKLLTPLDLKAKDEMHTRRDVGLMSLEVFGQEYSTVKGVLYPRPKYRSFLIKKRSGGDRLISEPRLPVKNLQLKALAFFEKHLDAAKPCVHGFVKGRSILTNAIAHCQHRASFVLNLDFEDFFPSITFQRVRGALQKPPFSFSFEVATVFAHLCTHQGKLPQGAPTSPYLSNLICRSVDGELMALAKRHRCTYTRYADDITFSFSLSNTARLPSRICSFDGGAVHLGEELREIITRNSFTVNEKKTRISSWNTRQVVTGLTINEFPNVTRRVVDEVRGALNAWKKYGYVAAQDRWERRIQASNDKPLKDRAWSRQTKRSSSPALKSYLWGKLLFIRMVRKQDDPLYSRLAERYNELVSMERKLSVDFRQPMLPVHFAVQNRDHAAKALYVIEWDGDVNILGKNEAVFGQGTAFAYKYRDMLITCEHVFRFELGSENIDFKDVPNAELKVTNVLTGKESVATLLHKDMDRDLAVLKLPTPLPQMRHFIRAPNTAEATHTAWLLGFPNWSNGKRENIDLTTVATVFPMGALKRFEINSTIRKGNSGGPVISDKSFGLWGVAQQGATHETGNNQCLCVSELDAWLNGLGVEGIF